MRTALLNGSCATIKFESLSPTGPASAKHLSAKLKCVFAPEAATCSVEVSPACDTLRNVWIHKSPQLFRPFDAPGVNSMLQRMLNKVSTDEAERSRVLGPGYEQLRVWMSGQDPPRVPQATTSVRGCRVANGCEDSSPGELPLKKRKTKA
ncbi:hypothetical protein PsYK624_036230 [Phanerochaete sordida]|uniref:Uncharacterized protein n=1 Tax=Phanerochaete sordida TaxID=48140 RepID=A0A9P3G4Q5_9APHY|nr:hypothetical protein PsYK624_036230 [Phanerochaete sordida]